MQKTKIINIIIMNYQTSADYMYIDAALKSVWKPFEELIAEIDTFSPRPLSDFENERRKQLEHLKKMNPTSSNKEIEDFVDRQISFAASYRVQFSNRFSERFMTQYVLVVLLSHSLCEAVINAILAIGLAQSGSEELFGFFEKASIKEKWRFGPKSFYPAYDFPASTATYETLVHLAKQRNAFVHYKIQLQVEGKKIFDGSALERQSFQESIRWVRRFFSLPYDLAAQAQSQVKSFPMMILTNRAPIPIAEAHKR